MLTNEDFHMIDLWSFFLSRKQHGSHYVKSNFDYPGGQFAEAMLVCIVIHVNHD